jgi:hypothetical protein
MAVKIQLRGDTAANWASVNPIIADREMVLETDTDQFKIGNGVDTYSALPYGGIQGPASTLAIQDFGNGEDGNVTISAGVTTLTQDMYYNNLTITGSGQLRTNGYRVFVKGTLDLQNAAYGAITLDGNNGSDALTQTGASAGGAYVAATLGANTAGGAGATGVVGVGAQAALTTATTPSNGGGSGAGGAGGAGSSGAGGISRAGATATVAIDFARFTYDIIRGVTLVQAGAGGPGGSSGAGDGVNSGRGGGGGGAGGGVLYIAAKNIIKDGLTAAGAISAKGGRGGNGATASVGNVGGGGGAGGGGGGYIILFYETLSGTVVTNFLDASGGDGGNAGNGFGTGIGGTGGTGGTGGRIRRHKTSDQTGATTIGSAGVAGSAGVGTVGGAGGAGGSCKATL